jgi:Arc/MetJ family transcription regulator
MRTNIEIDEKLMQQAMKASGSSTKRQTVETGLKLLVRLHRQRGIKALRGALRWKGNLDAMRRDK